MELQAALEQRYSCRGYKEEEPSREQIISVLEAGRLSPSARNLQPQRVYVVTGQDKLSKLDECVVNRYKAPVAFIIGYEDTEASMHNPERLGGSAFTFGEHDATSVLVHMALKATDMGMATCWLGAINDLKLKETFDIPESVNVRAVLVMGFPSEDKGVPSPLHTTRRPLEETVTWV